MAKSGSFNTSGYSASDGSRCLTFSWSIISQNIATNTTTISWTLTGAGTSTQWIYSGNFKVVIAGQTVYSSTTRIKLLNGTTVASGTFTFTHSDDGTKSFSASAEAGIYNHAVNCSGSKEFTLDTIARASQPSLVTWPETTNNVGDFGKTFNIHMNRKSSAFIHTVRYEYGNRTGTIETNVADSTSWAVPLDFMNDIPNDTSASGRIYVDTYNGTTKVGTKYTGFTVTVPTSVKPSCTIQVLDDTNIKDTYGSLVKGLSKLYVKTTFKAAYSSPVTAYNVTANGVKYTDAEIVTGVLTADGTTTITATVKDERERTSDPVSASFPVLDYSPPKITDIAVHRCNQDGTANDRGEYVEVVFSSEVTSLNNKNTATYTVKYKKSSADSWTILTTDVNGWKPVDLKNNFAVYNQSYIFAADGDSSYDVVVSVTDNHKTDSRPTSASTAFTLINYHPAGNAIRFGGVAEEENAFQNDLTFIQTGNQYAFSSIGAASTDGYILMARITVTDTNSDSPITFVFSQRKAPAPMTVHILFNSTDDTDPGLASIMYEGNNYDAYLTSPSESVWDLYVKKVNNSDTITLNTWHTSYRQMKRMKIDFVGSIASQVPLGRFGYYHATQVCPFPVGFILHMYSHTDPNTAYPYTTWVRIPNAFLWGCDAKGDIGGTGGEKTHTLTIDEMPSHTHAEQLRVHGYSGWADYTTSGYNVMFDYNTDNKYFSGGQTRKTALVSAAANTYATGGGAAHNNMPPYVQVSIWRRTA